MVRHRDPAVHRLAQEVMSRCDFLATFSEEPGAVTRTFLSPPMHDVHRAVSDWLHDAGMTVHVDNAGNIHGVRTGKSPREIVIGSHLDTVPNAGRYDGILGVLLGIATAKVLAAEDLPVTLRVTGFSEEEGVRFRSPFIGSKAWAGLLSREDLQLLDDEGVSVREAIAAFGLDPVRIDDFRLDPENIIAFLETHIEQGPVLESAGQPVGVVAGIAGQTKASFRLCGRADHAGTTPHALRKDALLGMAELLSKIEALTVQQPTLRATVGNLQVLPNATNVVPSEVRFTLDARHLVDADREVAVTDILRHAGEIAARRGLEFHILQRQDSPAVDCNRELRAVLSEAIRECGISPMELVSGAGHDAMIMGKVVPMGMLFLRCREGRSHCPEENVMLEDVRVALSAMVGAVRKLAMENRNL